MQLDLYGNKVSNNNFCSFLYWVGGKTKLLPVIDKFIPDNIEFYIEPFIGGGAVLYHLLQKQSPSKVIINDLNHDLINAYNQVKNNPNDLISILSNYEKEYRSLEMPMREQYYYNIRDQFNNKSYDLTAAAQCLFLNRTAFNSLYRVNKSGNFNAPHGRHKKRIICDTNNILKCSEALKNVIILNKSFEEVILSANINNNTFIYLDPPYDDTFTSYTPEGFNNSMQETVLKTINYICDNNGKFLLSNLSTDYIRDLYKDYNITETKAYHSLSCKGSSRGKVKEVLISNR
jgi:DNA adenine methylase